MSDAVVSDERSGENQVLEFDLSDERFCLDIADVSEIVDLGDVTTVPDTPAHVEGVMELRDETARIVDPKRLLDVEGDADGEYVIVLDDDGADGPTGWLVDAVYQVATVTMEDVDRDEGDGPVRGVVNADHGFVVWVDPAATTD